VPGTTRQSGQLAESADLELSVVIPCLNGADTIGTCVEKARALRENGIAGEIVVADNGSTDPTGFGNLDYRDTLRWVVPGATLTALGVQTMLSSFFVSILGLSRR
jgi:hypothetical protein